MISEIPSQHLTKPDATVRPPEQSRLLEIIAATSAALLLVVLALTLGAIRTGDGHYYFAMLEGLANSGSPAITPAASEAAFARLGLNTSTGMVITGTDGRFYAWHFFAYPLINVPAYKLLQALDLDVLKSFQLTNAALVALSLIYILVLSRLPCATRWFIAGGLIFSSGTIYFQCTDPVIFSAVLVLLASIGLVERRYPLAALMAALSSLQNPSSALLIIAVFGAQAWDLRGHYGRGLFTRASLFALSATVAAATVALIPYAWNIVQFGAPNPIASNGSILFSNINLRRLISFVFDLNQGLIVGLPLLLWAVPIALLARMASIFTTGRPSILKREDWLLIAFVLMALPTLGQTNWNAAHGVFLRYAAWSGMALLVWIGVSLGGACVRWRAGGLVPALALQIVMALCIGGLSLMRFPSYVSFMPWVVPMWNHFPHFYHPLPDIYFERLKGYEGNIIAPAILAGKNGELIRILSHQPSIELVGEEVCGPQGTFMPADLRSNSLPKISNTELGFSYVTGRLVCSYRLPTVLSTSTGSGRRPIMNHGWSDAEQWGTWSSGTQATLQLNFQPPQSGEVVMTIIGNAFVNELHHEQQIILLIDGQQVDAWTVRHPATKIERRIVIDSQGLNSQGRLSLEFKLPNATSPSTLGLSGDSRKLALWLSEIRLETLNP
jgi:hypothetical protein